MTTLARQATRFPALRSTQPARQIAHTLNNLRGAWSTWKQARRQARADRQMWSVAQDDARVMTDLTCAISRHGN